MQAHLQTMARLNVSYDLLTYEGDGHTAYGSGSSCIDRAIDAVFLSGTMPPAGKTCR